MREKIRHLTEKLSLYYSVQRVFSGETEEKVKINALDGNVFRKSRKVREETYGFFETGKKPESLHDQKGIFLFEAVWFSGI